MKYKCTKCGEIYDEEPQECDFDNNREFKKVVQCESCLEYEEYVFNNCCKNCIMKEYTPKKGMEYLKHLDAQRIEWGLEPYFLKEFNELYNNKYETFDINEKKAQEFLLEYCLKDEENFYEFI